MEIFKCFLIVWLAFKYVKCQEWNDGSLVRVFLNETSPTLTNSEVHGSINSLTPMSTAILAISNIPPPIDFIIVQIHCHKSVVTLSYGSTLDIKNHVNGTNVGLIIGADAPKPLFVSNFSPNETIFLYLSIHSYMNNAPVPGGCNMEFNVKDAPYLRISHDPMLIKVEASQARISFNGECNVESENVTHTYYRLLLSEWDHSSIEYFNTLQKMLTLENILKYGQKIELKSNFFLLRRLFSAYPRMEAFYVVVAGNSFMSSVYVPVHSYRSDDETSKTELFLMITATVMGFFMVLLGFFPFRYQIHVSGLLISLMFVYSICVYEATSLLGMLLFFATLYGCVIVCSLTFYFIEIFPPTLFLLGFLMACLTFCILPDFLQLFITFWAVLLCIIFIFILLPEVKHSYFAASSIVGSFCIIISFDSLYGSYLRYIIVNVLRHVLVEDFDMVNSDIPFRWKDGVTAFLWIFSSLTIFILHIKLVKFESRHEGGNFFIVHDATENTALLGATARRRNMNRRYQQI